MLRTLTAYQRPGGTKNKKESAFNTRPPFCDHARLRCAQRNVSPAEVYYIIEYGHRIHNAGAIFIDLRRCDLRPSPDICNQRLEQLVGTTVVLDGNGTVVKTVYRNGEAPKINRCKAKYNRYERAA